MIEHASGNKPKLQYYSNFNTTYTAMLESIVRVSGLRISYSGRGHLAVGVAENEI